MITLEASIHCSRCRSIIASGEPSEHWRSAIDSAIAHAKAKGAQIGLVSALCQDCTAEQGSAARTCWPVAARTPIGSFVRMEIRRSHETYKIQ